MMVLKESGPEWLLWPPVTDFGQVFTVVQIGSKGSNPVVQVPRKIGIARCPAKGQSLAINGRSQFVLNGRYRRIA